MRSANDACFLRVQSAILRHRLRGELCALESVCVWVSVFHVRVYARVYRCRINGEGGRKVSLSLHLNTDARRQPYCGVQLDVRRPALHAYMCVAE
jgi:hypothetical protein